MCCQLQNVIVGRQSYECASKQWAARQIEWPGCLALTDLLGLPFVTTDIDTFELEIQSIQDPLLRLTLVARKYGPQRLMPRDNPIQRLFQLRDLQLATDRDCAGKVVGGAARLELIEKPDALLRKTQRQPLQPRSIERPLRSGGRAR